jgi:hypothetical protein
MEKHTVRPLDFQAAPSPPRPGQNVRVDIDPDDAEQVGVHHSFMTAAVRFMCATASSS